MKKVKLVVAEKFVGKRDKVLSKYLTQNGAVLWLSYEPEHH